MKKKLSRNVKVINSLLLLLLFAFIYLSTIDSDSTKPLGGISTPASEVSNKIETITHDVSLPNISHDNACINLKIINNMELDMLHSVKDEFFYSLFNIESKYRNDRFFSELSRFSGVSFLDFRQQFSTKSSFLSSPLFSLSKVPLASDEQQILLNNLKELEDIEKFISIVQNDKAILNVAFSGKLFMVFLLGSLLESDFVVRRSEKINALLDSGYRVTLSDMTIAIESGLELNLIEKMYRSSDFSADIILNRFQAKTSFAVYALKNRNIELYQFWVDRGSSIAPDMFQENAFDVVLKDASWWKSKGYFSDLIYHFINEGITPTTYNVDSSILIKANLKKEMQIHLESNYLKRKSDIQLTPDENSYISSLKLRLARIFEVAFNKHKAVSHDCRAIGTKEILAYLLKKIEQSETLKKSNISNNKSNKVEKVGTAVVLRDRESIIFGNGSIENKRAVENYRQSIFAEKAEKILDSYNSEENLDAVNSMKDVYRLARLGLWDDALELLTKLELNDREAATNLLPIAISLSAELEVIKKLLERGAYILDNAIIMLVMSDNVKLATFLTEQYALNINYKDPLGTSALVYSVKFRKYEMFKFLIRQNVDFDSESKILDALDHALINYNVTPDATDFVGELILSGFPVKVSHRQIVEEMYHSDLESYLKLTNRFPDLII